MAPSRRAGDLQCAAIALALAGAGAAPLLAAEAAATGAATDSAPAEAPADDVDRLRQRLKVLEDLVTKLQADLELLRGQSGAGGVPPATSIKDLEKKIDALTQEIARLRQAEAPPSEETGVNGLDPSASKVYRVSRGLVMGGYGSALYERFTHSRDDDTPSTEVNRTDLAEAFLNLGYRFDDRFLFNTSLGIEHALVEDGSTSGEAAVEFAYIDYKANRYLGARGGLLLVPLGWLNELHNPAGYLGARRPEIEQRIIPTTWREVGAGVYGDAGPVTWRAYLLTGPDAAGFTAEDGIREGRQQGSEARAGDLGLTARVDYRPLPQRAFGDLVLGAATFTGDTGQDRPGFPPGRLTLWDLHGQYDWRGLRLRALRVQGILSDAGEISLAIDPTGATVIAERTQGWYAEIGYDTMEFLKKPEQKLIAFCRYERLHPQEKVAPGFAPDPENRLTAKTCGLSYDPIPNLVIKLDAQNFDNEAHTATDQVNLGLGWAF